VPSTQLTNQWYLIVVDIVLLCFDRWTQLMHMAVQAMHDEGITVEQIRECNARAPFREATLECLRLAHRQGAHVVILSDANTL
jgi:hypothetical protein